MVVDHQLSRSKACKLVGLSRSALYKPKTNWATKDAPVVDALNEIVAVRARWGFWKCFTRMRKDGHPWNRKLPHQVDNSKLEIPVLNVLGMNSMGVLSPRESWGLNSL